MDWLYAIALFVVIGLIRPVFWTLALSTSLWIGQKFLSEKSGKLVFGQYWHPRKQKTISAPHDRGAERWIK